VRERAVTNVMWRFNLKKLNDMGDREECQVKISKTFAILKV
jgi:hypothetical protein